MAKKIFHKANLKVIIFDFDGVILDSWEHAYEGTSRSWPELTPERHRNFFNGNIHQEIAKLPKAKYSPEEHSKWFHEVHEVKKKELLIFPGVSEVIKKLATKYILVINTSANSLSTKELLESNGINVFTSVYGLESSKNKIDKFKSILNDNNVKENQCMFITDTVGDVNDANLLSIPTLLVSWGYQDRSHFSDVAGKVVGIIDEPEDILNYV